MFVNDREASGLMNANRKNVSGKFLGTNQPAYANSESHSAMNNANGLH
jgi:hypothetical protein